MKILANIAIALALLATRVAHADGDAARGEQLYEGCMDCHALDKNEIGPKHRGVFGRPAGIIAGYSYSTALKNSGIVWNQDSLNQWLTNPQTLVPGSKMFFKVPNAQDRQDIIAFLRDKAK